MNLPTLRLFDGYSHTSPELKKTVLLLQEELKLEGYNVTPDGYFGEGTEAAVKQFQSEKGLLSDGITGPVTWSLLLENTPVSSGDLFSTTYLATDKNMLKHNAEATKYKAFIIKAASQYDISSAIVCAIGSRESAWGLALKPLGVAGTGDFTARRFPSRYRTEALPPNKTGYGRGLMQIDYDAHEFARTGKWQDAAENIKYGCSVFSDCRNSVSRNTKLTGLKLIKTTLAAYNCGPSRAISTITQNLDVDYYTAGRDYSKDVVNRAGFFQLLGWL